MVGWKVDGPDRSKQVGDDDVLLALGAVPQLGAGATALEQHCGGVGVAFRFTGGSSARLELRRNSSTFCREIWDRCQ